MRKRLGLAALLLVWLLGGLALPVAAQDGEGLSPEDQALLDRANAALAALVALDNVAVDYQGHETFEVAILSSVVQTGMTGVVLFVESPNVTAQMTVTEDVTYHLADVPQQEVYTLTADVLRVAGQVYVRAGRTVAVGDEDTMPVMPEGWVQVETDGAYPALRVLPLDRLLAGDVAGWLLPLPLEAGAVFESPALVKLDTAQRDGVTVDNIVIMLERAGTTDDGDTLEATTEIIVTLDPDDDMLLGYAITETLTLTTLDASRSGIQARAEIAVIFTAHNAEGVEPAAAPVG